MRYTIEKELVCNGCKHLWHKCSKCTALAKKKRLGKYSWFEHKDLNSIVLNNKKYVLKDSTCPGFVRK